MTRYLVCDDGRPEHALPFCDRYGFGIEVQAFHDPALLERDPAAIESHRRLVSKVPLRACHGCFGDLAPGSFDSVVREAARQRFELSYATAVRLGASHLVLHHGYVPHTSSPAGWLSRCAAFWKEFLADKDDRISFHVENMLEWEPGLIADLIDAIGDRRVDVNLDIGHAHCNSRTPLEAWIRALHRRIGYLHLHDNLGKDDEHRALGHGNIPLRETLSLVLELAPDAFWAIESDLDDMEASIAWLGWNGFLGGQQDAGGFHGGMHA